MEYGGSVAFETSSQKFIAIFIAITHACLASRNWVLELSTITEITRSKLLFKLSVVCAHSYAHGLHFNIVIVEKLRKISIKIQQQKTKRKSINKWDINLFIFNNGHRNREWNSKANITNKTIPSGWITYQRQQCQSEYEKGKKKRRRHQQRKEQPNVSSEGGGWLFFSPVLKWNTA